MRSVHPTETADSGKLQYQSRYIKDSDSLDEIILCGMCGFPTDLKTRPSGDSYGAIGNPAIKTENVAAPFWMPSQSKVPAYVNTYGDPQGGPGCSFCGTLNPQAKGRGQSGFDKTVRSILGL
jgi:hypothetical protein